MPQWAGSGVGVSPWWGVAAGRPATAALGPVPSSGKGSLVLEDSICYPLWGSCIPIPSSPAPVALRDSAGVKNSPTTLLQICPRVFLTWPHSLSHRSLAVPWQCPGRSWVRAAPGALFGQVWGSPGALWVQGCAQQLFVVGEASLGLQETPQL